MFYDSIIYMEEKKRNPFVDLLRRTTWANRITFMRFLLIPFIIFFYIMASEFYSFAHWGKMVALVLYIIAAATDWLDGFVAKRFNQITDTGKLLDPFIDKLLVVAALCLLVTDSDLQTGQFGGIMPMFAAAIVLFLIIGRDLTVGLIRQLAATKGLIMSADRAAKGKTLLLLVSLGMFMFYAANFSLYRPIMTHLTFLDIYRYTAWFVLGSACVLSIISCVNYFIRYIKLSESEVK